ncbi:Hypothetical predicted protein [Pelobates cultripes]|uniref:Uncharacterized protein n=1 Tax=Pelobates cultripes TaxID=61616 RepID=A0AAD1RE06_PELCU|nr:Hypothetical predicted protein [Pelobates cultripes]
MEITLEASPGISGDEADFSADFTAPADMQALTDTSMAKAMINALVSVMEVMSDSLSQTFAQTLLQAQRSAQPTTRAAVPVLTPALLQPGHKASYKAKNSSKTIEIDSTIPVTDGAINLPPCKRATSQAKLTRLWKRAKAQLNSEYELSDIEEEFPESYMEEYLYSHLLCFRLAASHI